MAEVKQPNITSELEEMAKAINSMEPEELNDMLQEVKARQEASQHVPSN